MMKAIENEYDEFVISARRAVNDVRHGIHLASWHHIILCLMGVVLCIGGLSGQVVCLNWWLTSYPAESNGWPAGGVLSSLITTTGAVILIYGFVLAIHCWRARPSMAFLRNPSVWWHGIAGGLCFGFNGQLVISATPKIPETTQSILLSSQIIWTFLFAVILKVNKGKNYIHPLVIFSVVISIAGIILGTLATKSGSGPSTYSDVGAWIVIFAGGIAAGAITNVIAASFLQRCAFDDKADDPVVVAEEEKQWIESHPDLAAAVVAGGGGGGGAYPDRVRVGSGGYDDEVAGNTYYAAQKTQVGGGAGGSDLNEAIISKNNSFSRNNNINHNGSAYIENQHHQNNNNNNNSKTPIIIDQNRAITPNTANKQQHQHLVVGGGSNLSGTDATSMATPQDLPHPPVSHSHDDLTRDVSEISIHRAVEQQKKNSSQNRYGNNNNIDDHSIDEDDEEQQRQLLLGNDGGNNKNSNDQDNKRKKKIVMTANGLYERTDMGTGKNVFLLLSSFFMMIALLVLAPTEALPFYGSNPGNLSATMHSLENGLLCVFDSLPDDDSGECKKNAVYFVLFSIAFASTNAGQVIISEFSPALAALVSQISSPLTTIILLIAPGLSPKPVDANPIMCSFAALMLILGSLMFGFWEQMMSMRIREAQPNPYANSEYDDGATTCYNEDRFSSKYTTTRNSRVHVGGNQQQQYNNNHNNHKDEVGSYGTLEA